MNYRNAVLLPATTGFTTGTEPINIDVADPISRIQILVYATNVDSAPDGHPAALVVKAEIVDGSELLFSLEGRQAQAMSYFDTGKLDQNGLIYQATRTGWATLSLNFGRWLYDPELAFDPKQFKNPQLKIQYAIANGLSSITSLGLKVMADMFDEKVVTPVGYLLSKEAYSFTPADGGLKYIDLPGDMPIRKLVVISPSDDTDISDQAGTPLIDEENGKRVLFDLGAADMKRWHLPMYGDITEHVLGVATSSGVGHYVTVGSVQGLSAMMASAVDEPPYHSPAAGLKKTIYTTSDDSGFYAMITGQCPHGSYPILFGKQDDIDDWWDVTKVGKPRLQLKPTSSVDTGTDVSVLTQRLAIYK